jgi:ABC-type polysaccharide/polyol phosphate export permease
MWTSAIFYPAEIVPESFRVILNYNPVFLLINMIRQSLLYGTLPEISSILYVGVIAIFFLVLGVFLLYKYQDRLMLYI